MASGMAGFRPQNVSSGLSFSLSILSVGLLKLHVICEAVAATAIFQYTDTHSSSLNQSKCVRRHNVLTAYI